ncbi:MAG: hypothetical protein KAT37_00490 [Candidatus Aenigmarchaeota archaeon]|nr:hypothetical protein [Candidatus Aenigmarchaeota archaeon]
MNRIDAEYYSLELDDKFHVDNFQMSEISPWNAIIECKERVEKTRQAYALGTGNIFAFVRPTTDENEGKTVLVTKDIQNIKNMAAQNVYMAHKRGCVHENVSDKFYKDNGHSSESVLNRILRNPAIENHMVDLLAVCEIGNHDYCLSLFRREWLGGPMPKTNIEKAFKVDEKIKPYLH